MLLIHRGAVGHELGTALLPLSILQRALLSASAPLPDTEEGKGEEGEEGGAGDRGRDGDLRRVRERVPLLLGRLRGRRVVVAVKRQGFGRAVERKKKQSLVLAHHLSVGGV